MVGKYLIVSPGAHTIHHSMEIEHRDKNFAFMFPIIDHIFGTYYKGSKVATSIGIDKKISKSMFKQIKADTFDAISLILKK